MEFFPLSGSCREICQLEERDLLQRVGKCSEDESSSAVDCTLSLGFSSSASTDVDVKSMGWKKGGHAEIFVRRCLMCGTTQTPLWRNGPNGAKVEILDQSLCNACGIRFKKEEKRANLMRGTSMFHSKKPKPGHHTAAQDPLLSGP